MGGDFWFYVGCDHYIYGKKIEERSWNGGNAKWFEWCCQCLEQKEIQVGSGILKAADR